MRTYARIDGGPDCPGYFTAKSATLRGDVNGDNFVSINDLTALIDYLLSGNDSSINLEAADCNLDGHININDITALIDYLLKLFDFRFHFSPPSFTINENCHLLTCSLFNQLSAQPVLTANTTQKRIKDMQRFEDVSSENRLCCTLNYFRPAAIM